MLSKTQIGGQHVLLPVGQPMCILDYNAKMGGVDVFGQHIAAYRSLPKTNKYWKTIVIDLVDAVTVNGNHGNILFNLSQGSQPRVDHPP